MDVLRKNALEVMAAKSISGRQIMRETGISHVTVAKFLHGKGVMRDATIIQLCLFLGVDWYKSNTDTKDAQKTTAAVTAA